MQTFAYALTPFITWLIAGSLKFAINSLRAKQAAFGLIGYGGFPSNHSAIVSSMATLIALREGFNNAAFGVSVTLAFIVMLDANSLRRQLGLHAQRLNEIADADMKPLRERMGHSRMEILGGIATGIITAYLVTQVL